MKKLLGLTMLALSVASCTRNGEDLETKTPIQNDKVSIPAKSVDSKEANLDDSVDPKDIVPPRR